MDSPILKEITKFLHERKKQRRNTILFACAALVVVAGTAAALRMIGQAMTRKEKVLVCNLQVHEHDDDCYDDDGNLICGLADYVVHVHNDDCYDATGELVCTLPEIEPHEHTDECYEEEEVLVCTEEESDGHVHTDDCYKTVQGEEPVCGMEEHQHDDGCYDEEGNLACDLEEHEHSDDCYEKEEVLACGKEEGDGGHTHTDACYEKQKVLACGKLELHAHDEEKCYEEDEDGNLILTCDIPVLEEHVHSDELGCFEIREAVTEADVEREYFSEEPETEEPDDVSATESGEASEDEKTVFTTEDDGEDAEGETAEDTGNAEDVSATEPETPQITKTYEGDGYKVTASYTEEAGLPEEAELIAEQITPESDSERFAKRAAEYKEALGDENATPKALFNIGFYVDGEEVEPKVPVTITIQFLDENGLPEGTPVTVVHFGDEGNEVLDGGKMEDGSTSFQMSSFSDAMVGTGINKNQPLDIEVSETGAEYLKLNHDFPYENEHFIINFHVEGDASVPGNISPLNVSGTEPVSEGMTEDISDGAKEAGESTAEPVGFANDVPDSETTEGDSKERVFTTESVEGGETSSDKMIQEDSEEESSEDSEEETSSGEESGDSENQTEEDSAGDVVSDENKASSVSTNGDLALTVAMLDEDSEEHGAFAEHVEKTNKGGEILLLQAFSYILTYKEQELNLTNCKVTVSVTPISIPGVSEEKAVAEEEPAEMEDPTEFAESGTIELVAMTYLAEGVRENNSIRLASDAGTTNYETMVADMSQGDVVALAESNIPNPNFTVQYYANIEKFEEYTSTDEKSEKSIDIIDTSKEGNQKKGKDKAGLPKNGDQNLTIKRLAIANTAISPDSPSTRTAVKTKMELTEMYSSKKYEYVKAPSLNYFNVLAENGNYELKEIWILKTKAELGHEPDPTSTTKTDWQVLTYNPNDPIHFTNKQESQNTGKKIYWIRGGAVLRLVYDTTKYDTEVPATFYDYDISSGTKSKVIQIKGTDGKDTGIHSSLQLDQPNQYAFGNDNMSNYATSKWKGNLLNRANDTNGGNSYSGCTFGLVSGVKRDAQGGYSNDVNFDGGINAPDIFGNNRNVAGKTIYDQGNLTYKRKGDSYTLFKASVKDGNNTYSIGNLDQFWWRWSWGNKRKLWANNFWPLDKVSVKTDPIFGVKGDYTYERLRKGVNSDLKGGAYTADDNQAHNCFFGMYSEVKFKLVPEYIGPLEYYFFGDDDLWVFLDGELVCDIGGVHGSVGEYVDLWDYIEKGKDNKEHTLQFFYTERGAAGSTCWMHFTLPSLSHDEPVNKDFGHLQVSKKVTRDLDPSQVVEDNDAEFTFHIKLHDKNNNPLPDHYSYEKYKFDEEGNKVFIRRDLIMEDGSDFTLKNGEYILVKFLPDGAQYTVEETNVDPDYEPTIEESGKEEPTKKNNITGTIKKADQGISMEEVTFNNMIITYNLPKTGGPGTTNPYTIACILCVLGAGGAGFLYRKKFRERRVRRSS